MELSRSDLAGVVDLFDALTRAELGDALVELAFKDGAERDPADFDAAIEDALDAYHLVEYEDGHADDPLLVPGPVAFPTLPDGATDLPHILDVPERTVDRDAAGRAAAERFRADAARAVNEGNTDRAAELLDVSYELEAWAPVALADARERLDDELA
ncbi:DUF7109 family protein [Halorientalis litorea]|jgi:hypothetical protein|uniref:DUF7109 family protein n=1 Tax=Halorientalis litorea TaxID=2931977 RepID=UPI001FF6BC27|nr:hypothetical protein [Halorientalis litorea]